MANSRADGIVSAARHDVSCGRVSTSFQGVVFVAGVTRTATCTARTGVDVATGEVLTEAVLVQRVG
jgi:hypothetical protein